jgi:hypothetical protein
MQTYTRVFCAVAIALCAAPIAALAADPRPCELFSPKEIASVLGVTPERGQPSGPDVVKDFGATKWTCQWLVGERYFFAVDVTRVGSAADATRGWRQLVKELTSSSEDEPPLIEVPGPGEQNLWRPSLGSGIWVSRKGQTVLVIVAGDAKLKLRPESLREPIRDLVVSGLKRLP